MGRRTRNQASDSPPLTEPPYTPSRSTRSMQAKNYDADLHSYKGKIEDFKAVLPRYVTFQTFVVDPGEHLPYVQRMTNLTTQRIKISKALTEIHVIIDEFKPSYENMIDMYRNETNDIDFKHEMDKLEIENDVTGNLRLVNNIKKDLSSLLIEVDEVMQMHRELHGPSTISNISHTSEPEHRKQSSIKLSSVDVPVFSGDPEEFPSFIASFDQLVHRNIDLSEIEKGIRLQQCLKGRAAMCIQGIPITSENYTTMYVKLRRKFELASANKHVIAEKLENLPESGRSADDCLDKLNEIDVILNQLDSAKMGIRDSTNLMFHRLVLTKFPTYIVERVVEKTKDDNFRVDDLMQALESVIFSKNFSQKAMSKKTENYSSDRIHPNRSRQQTTFVNSENRTANRNVPYRREFGSQSCCFCNQSHSAEICTLPIRDKQRILKEQRRCWKCFSSNHNSFVCSAPVCSCQGFHHQSICQTKRNEQPETWNRNNSWQRNGNNNRQNNTTNIQRLEMNNPSTPTRIAFPTQNNWRRPGHNTNGGHDSNHTAVLVEEDEISNCHTENLQQNHNSLVDKSNIPVIIPTLMTTEAFVFSLAENKYVKSTIFFDTGAQQTLVSETFAAKLGMKDGELNMFNMSGVNEKTESFIGRKISLQMLTEDKAVLNIPALTKPFISKGFSSANLDSRDCEFLQMQKIHISDGRTKGELQRPDILVGADNYTKLVLNKAAIRLPSGLTAIETVFGYCLFGYPCITQKNETAGLMYATHNAITCPDNEELNLNEMLKQMYELESLGIKHHGSPSEDNVIEYYDKYKNCISFENRIVTAPFPLRSDLSKLGDNYALAFKRLQSLIQSFASSADKKEHYSTMIDKYIADGVVAEVSPEDEPEGIAVYHIPHHAVWKPEKIHKPLRIVFDASAKQKGSISLNDAIETGQTFVNRIQDILMSIRKSKYIILCDIQGAFTQIRIVEEHQDLCRLLWVKDPSKSVTKENLKTYRFTRLPFGITASPSVLNMAIIAFLESVDSEIAHEILKLLYVDNVIMSADDEETVYHKIKESKEIFQQISFNLREYVTNVPTVNKSIREEDRGTFGETKILGVTYNTDSDNITVRINVKTEHQLTKRSVLKQLHTIYDPIGMVAPIIITLRFAMRDIFQATIHWSDKLSVELNNMWNSLINKYNNTEITIPRYLGDEHRISQDQIVWIFTDASINAFAACAYLQDKKSMKISKLIAGKTKLTPRLKKPVEDTIPKFEFSSILLGTELGLNVIRNLELQNCNLYIVNDSTSALTWVNSSKTLRRSCNLIRDKINSLCRQIEESFNVSTTFFHCPTDYNVADIGTRGCDPHALHTSDWVNGPKWAEKDLKELPLVEFRIRHIQTSDDDELQQPISVNQQIVTKSRPTVQIGDFSSSCTSFRATNAVARALNMLKRKLLKTKKSLNLPSKLQSNILTSVSGDIKLSTRKDLEIADHYLILSEQSGYEISALNMKYKGKNFFKDNVGLIRLRSRLQNSELCEDIKNPMFLPADSKWLQMLVKEGHNDNGHCGKEHLKMLIRQKLWIPKPSKVVNSIIKSCLACKKVNSLPFKAPLMSSLPIDRVKTSHAFANTGVDCLGPFETREKEKVYICLFTCLTFRGVHLEIIDDMSGSEFLKAFIRFTSRRGIPKLVRSDNGTNFVLGQKLISSLFEKDGDNKSVLDYFNVNELNWIFNPPEASWFGGVWEIMVKAVKQAFYKTVGRNKLSMSEFSTLIVKIEGVINSRPLTTFDNDDFIQPLRPIDFLCPGLVLNLPPFNKTINEDDDYCLNEVLTIKGARKAVLRIDQLFEKFLDRFQNEYLPRMRDAQKHILNQGRCSGTRVPRLHELVLIKDRLLPRHKWNMGKIIKLKTGKDGEIRSAIVDCGNTRLHRPIIHLFPLEINTLCESADQDQEIINMEESEAKVKQTKIDSIGKNAIIDSSSKHNNVNKRKAYNEATERIQRHAKRDAMEIESWASDSDVSELI